ncbi:MAG: hypothetical protein CM15mP109_05160 [Candidatus Dadabacteria bacterium]|nr:MAG: hypothetical protein CM15mP109_05160 [Candidatus Dadabacteria bacterium]
MMIKKVYSVVGHDKNVHRGFCPECGSPSDNPILGAAKLRFIKAGSLG